MGGKYPMTLALKTLNREQAPLLHELESVCHRFPMSLTNLETCFGRFYHVIGLFDDEELIGFAILHQLFEDATLMDICVRPTSQGQGLGKRLTEALIELAATQGAERMMLEVRACNERAIALYRQMGFVQTGMRPNYYQLEQGKEDAILMELLF
ncbi:MULTISPECIES: ribosomal protein S18-alanine N-acetyltransferase [Shewanella]|uniref:[Ribosomal protein bS18]-alanine N-acetyltransferase n=1 Tax=Shewanella marisflavi TaxID=260364 RepID=A0ABX5WIV4_9GAMM|nr:MULTISPECIES: ribosomal protein S18-alanine N-acetyltransferase [Shewanella]QDF74473.1 ribosomal-protein-alanine N-acetyltransferase [Shewanella marisflavi]